MKRTDNSENSPHRAKCAALLAELKNQYDLTGRIDAKSAAQSIGHGAVYDILYADVWLQSHLGRYVEAKRQRQAAARRRALRAPGGGEDDQRAALVQFCLDTVEEPEGASTGDKLRAVGLAAELLGLRKHVPMPATPDSEPDREGLEIEELYRQYPELAAGAVVGDTARSDSVRINDPNGNGTGANGANGKG